MKELSSLRKWEIKEWVSKMYQSAIMTKLEFDKKNVQIDSETFEDS